MSIAKELDFDHLIVRMQAQDRKKVFEVLAQKLSPDCNISSEELQALFAHRFSELSFGIGGGAAVFDMKSPLISTPVLVMSTFVKPIDFNAIDGRPVDIMAAVISPKSCGPLHLQRLSRITRVLRSDALRSALRDAQNMDEMRVLFMPTQDWMVAA